MKKKLVLSSDSFIWVKKNYALIFNVCNGNKLLFTLDNSIIQTICLKLIDVDNLYTVIFENNPDNTELCRWLSSIENLKLGSIVSAERNVISIPPKAFIMNNIERMADAGFDNCNILEYINSITIYLGGDYYLNEWFKQACYPLNSNDRLDAEDIIQYLSRINENNQICSSKIVVSDNSDKRIPFIGRELKKMDIKCTFVFGLKSYLGNEDIFSSLIVEGHSVQLSLSPSDIADGSIADVIKKIKKISKIVFLVDSQEQISTVDSFVDVDDAIETEYFPLWNGNTSFYSQNVQLNEDEIFDSVIDKKVIYIHQNINANYWGKLTIMPDGRVYANPASEISIGNIKSDVIDAVKNELKLNSAWRKIRSSGKCSKCLYQWLCPSETSFEYLSGLTACNNVLSGIIK